MVQKRRKQYNVPVVFRAAILVLALIVTFFTVTRVNAIIEVPPDNDIFFQTTGRNADIGVGDYYTNANGDDIRHLVEIYVPCISDEIFRIQLFDPELYDAGPPGTEDVDDEVRDEGDITSFRLFDPAGTVVTEQTFGPYLQPPDPAATPPPTHNNWIAFFTINLPTNPIEGDTCGIFQIETWTGNEGDTVPDNNDDNAWKYRLLGGPDGANIDSETFDPAVGPDGRVGTGDEAVLGIQRLSFQHNNSQEQTFYWFVDDAASPTWTGNNFDIDEGTPLCDDPQAPCEINYTSPSGVTTGATESGNAVWNPGQPGRLGDQFTNAEAGLWQADVNIPVDNQYIIEIENSGKPIFLEEPILPELIIAKDDGVEFVTSPGVTTYTITIENIGEGAALPIAGPEVIDTLPPGMTFGGCVVNPPLKGTCDQSAPGSGIINFELDAQDPALNQDGSDFGPILAYLPGTASGLIPQGTLTVIANIDPGLPGASTFTNTVTVDWTDLYKNNYKPKEAKDIDKTSSLDLQLSKRHIPIVVEPGGNLTYTITITNVGGAIATGVVITDQIPANTSFVMASDGGTFANGLITWNIPSLNINETVSRQVVVQLDDPLAPGVDAVTNTACVGDDGASGADRNPQDNCDTVTTPVTNTPQVFLDPIIVKTVDVSDVIPGDQVNYSVTISNPSTNSNISATDVLLIDEMPLEMDLISYSVSTNPASLVINSTTVTTDVVSTVGHPSGITQTIVSTITVELPELGLDQSVTLDIVARANGLAGPPPLDITNVAALECSGCNRKEDRKTVKVRDQGSSPTPTPTRPSGGGNNNDDDDDSGGNTNTSTTTSSSGGGQPSPSVSVPATATPVLPVLLLPETGTRDSQLPGPMALVGLLGAVSLGGLLMWKLLKGNSPE
ncbi:MAG: DUF11 domain-containing protein [Anaerolineales bacterium]|nr:DUF11 domain-containing protein [Anaerolineales bacterium]